MNCVYNAFQDHMKAIDEPEYADIFKTYRESKMQSHERFHQYTFAGVLPWLYSHMLFQHNLRSKNRIEMKIERSYLERGEYVQEGTPVQQRIIVYQTSYWGEWVDEYTLSPAIYCMLNEQHAMYAEEIPSWKGARILFAIQLVKMEKEK